MKKKLLCLFITLVMVLPLILASCGDEMTPEEIANANFREADTALTLSLWLPVSPTVDTDGDGVKDAMDSRFDDRLAAVNEAINNFLRSSVLSTELKIVAINENEYEEKLAARFAEIKELEKSKGKAYLTANDYINHAVKNEKTGVYELAYPPVLDTQLDIFYVGGFDNYVTYVNGGDAYALNEFFGEGQIYSGMLKKIRSIFMDATKIDGKYYAIPNNHVFSEGGQYVLVNKDLFDANADFAWDEEFDLFSLQSYIKEIGNKKLENVVPFVGTFDDIPGVVYLDKENLIASSIKDFKVDSKTGKVTYTPSLLNKLDEFETYTLFYKELCHYSFAAEKLDANQVAAVQMYNGNLLDIENKDDYYIIETLPPYASIETVFSSMFAISSHSANYDRAMQVLYLLQDNVEFRTLLQYGVEGVDYDVTHVNGEKVLIHRDTGYTMNLKYTGNCYRTYPDYGVPMSYWNDIIDYNLETELYPYLKLELMFNLDNVPANKIEEMNMYIEDLGDTNKKIYNAFEGMSYEYYRNVFDAISYSSRKIDENVLTATDSLNSKKAEYDAAVAALNAATNDADRLAAQEAVDAALENVRVAEDELEYWSGLKATVAEYPSLRSWINNTVRTDLCDFYNGLYVTIK